MGNIISISNFYGDWLNPDITNPINSNYNDDINSENVTCTVDSQINSSESKGLELNKIDFATEKNNDDDSSLPFWNNREGQHFTSWDRKFDNFSKIIGYCLQNDISSPVFEIVDSRNESVSFKLENLDFTGESVRISYVTYTTSKGFYFSEPNIQVNFYPSTNYIDGDMLLINNQTKSMSVYRFTDVLSKFFMQMPMLNNVIGIS